MFLLLSVLVKTSDPGPALENTGGFLSAYLFLALQAFSNTVRLTRVLLRSGKSRLHAGWFGSFNSSRFILNQAEMDKVGREEVCICDRDATGLRI